MGTNPIRKRRAITITAVTTAGTRVRHVVRSSYWYGVCPDCGEEAPDRHAYGASSTRKRAKDALYRHSRTHRPSLVETVKPRNA